MMPNPPARALARLHEHARGGTLAELCREHSLHLLVAFGSATNPEATTDARDLDLAVLPGDGFELLSFIQDIYELAGPVDVDVMDLRRAGPVARDRALAVCVPLYESESGLYARQHISAMLSRMDTAWMRRLDLDTMDR
jgi:hypothetical protein